jgi:hypothetical protein
MPQIDLRVIENIRWAKVETIAFTLIKKFN